MSEFHTFVSSVKELIEENVYFREKCLFHVEYLLNIFQSDTIPGQKQFSFEIAFS